MAFRCQGQTTSHTRYESNALKDYLNALKCTAPKIKVFKPLFVLNKLYILSSMVKIEGLCLSTAK